MINYSPIKTQRYILQLERMTLKFIGGKTMCKNNQKNLWGKHKQFGSESFQIIKCILKSHNNFKMWCWSKNGWRAISSQSACTSSETSKIIQHLQWWGHIGCHGNFPFFNWYFRMNTVPIFIGYLYFSFSELSVHSFCLYFYYLGFYSRMCIRSLCIKNI